MCGEYIDTIRQRWNRVTDSTILTRSGQVTGQHDRPDV